MHRGGGDLRRRRDSGCFRLVSGLRPFSGSVDGDGQWRSSPSCAPVDERRIFSGLGGGCVLPFSWIGALSGPFFWLFLAGGVFFGWIWWVLFSIG